MKMPTMHFVVVQMDGTFLCSDVILGVIKRKMLVEVGVLLYIVRNTLKSTFKIIDPHGPCTCQGETKPLPLSHLEITQ